MLFHSKLHVGIALLHLRCADIDFQAPSHSRKVKSTEKVRSMC